MKNKSRVFVLLFVWIFVVGYADSEKEFKFFKDGREISKEEFVANRLNGKEIVYDQGVIIAEAGFKNGQLHGSCVEWYRNRQKKCEGKYLSGRKDGKWLEWYDDGTKKIKANLLMGSKHGQYLEWHANGQQKSSGNYFIGREEGLWLKWDLEGRLIFEELWKQGRLLERKDKVHKTKIIFIYYQEGQKKYRKEFMGDLRHGKWCKWFINGQKLYEYEYRDGMKHGELIEWDSYGEVAVREIWKEGRLINKIR